MHVRVIYAYNGNSIYECRAIAMQNLADINDAAFNWESKTLFIWNNVESVSWKYIIHNVYTVNTHNEITDF